MKNHDQATTNLKKARSHIEKIIKMEEEGAYCIDVMQQLNAVIGYLNSAKASKLEHHLEHCFMEGMEKKSNEEKNKLIEEVMKVTKMTR